MRRGDMRSATGGVGWIACAVQAYVMLFREVAVPGAPCVEHCVEQLPGVERVASFGVESPVCASECQLAGGRVGRMRLTDQSRRRLLAGWTGCVVVLGRNSRQPRLDVCGRNDHVRLVLPRPFLSRRIERGGSSVLDCFTSPRCLSSFTRSLHLPLI